MVKKSGLGRGLSAIIPEYVPVEEEKKGSIELDIIDVVPNKSQPRKKFEVEKLNILAHSIEQHGVVQPILVRKLDDCYEIVAGERRWRAAKIAGLKQIPAVITELDDQNVMEVALIENLQREDLNPLEEAKGYKFLMVQYKLTQEQVAIRVSKSRSSVTNSLRLLNLNSDVQSMVENGDISEGHAKVILGAQGKAQFDIAKQVIEKSLSVRETEKLVKMLVKKPKVPTKTDDEVKNYLLAIQEDVSKYIGAKVNIVSGKKKGKIEIEYYSDEDFERILNILKGA